MNYQDIVFELDQHIATITLNRPQYSNAFSPEMLASWEQAIRRCQEDEEVRVVLLTGKGKSFCAGGDMRSFLNPELRAWDMKNFLQQKVHRVALAIEALEKPLIAAINGPAYGAGMDMALMCDIRIASEKAKFCESYLKLGVAPGDGGAFLLPRIVGLQKALELLLTAKTITAEEAEALGIVNRVVKHEELMDESLRLAHTIASFSPEAVRITKKAVYQGLTSSFSHHLDYISSQMGLLCETQFFKKAIREAHEKLSKD